MKRVYAFVDISNLFYCMGRKFPEKKLDFEKLINLFKDEGDLVRAVAYGAQSDKREANGFIKYLKRTGFVTKWKYVKTYFEGSRKADWDVGIAVDVIKVFDRADVIVLSSADGDLEPVAQYAKESGIRVVVVGCDISRDLREAADFFVEVDEKLFN